LLSLLIFYWGALSFFIFRCALRNTIEITGLSVKDLRIEEGFRA